MHANWRQIGTSCPIDGLRLSWSKCGDCRFFRGMSQLGKDRKILCNFPVNGTEVYAGPDLSFDAARWAQMMED